ncbi:MAG TPA: EamA family transporter [Mycobacteriales bacterium]|nr:EamA family transporter [Mycobacteriales bacterium]
MQLLDRPRVGPTRVHGLYVLNALFHYAGPAIAVLTFPHVGVAGAIWLRIASAALAFAVWRRPWRVFGSALSVGMGATLAAMNAAFYLAIDRLPLSTVGAVEFLGIICLAAAGVRNRRNALALLLAVAGVAALADIRIATEPLGFLFAFGNCALFAVYVMLGHRIASSGVDRVDQLGASMIIAAVLVLPAGVIGHDGFSGGAAWSVVGVGVGICSSVIPYVIDQAIMARIRRASFALLLSILPATATVVGMVVLTQIPTPQDLAGIGLVVCGVMIHEAEGT